MQTEITTKELVMKELNSSLLGETLDEETFLTIFNGLVCDYVKMQNDVSLAKKEKGISVSGYTDEIQFLLTKLIITLPKYATIFEANDYDMARENYIEMLPKGLTFKGDNYQEILGNAFEKLIYFAAQNRLESKDSGLELTKAKYVSPMLDYERDSAVVTNEFLSVIEAQRGAEGKKKLLEHIAGEGLDAIDSEIDYYKRLTAYLSGFYANIEIAKYDALERN